MENLTKIFSTLGASNHSKGDRIEFDFYATPSYTIEDLLTIYPLLIPKKYSIWEPACGLGHLSIPLKEKGFDVFSSDIHDHGYQDIDELFDFLKPIDTSQLLQLQEYQKQHSHTAIVTNPPYKQAQQFVERSIELLKKDGDIVCMFLKVLFLESQKRRILFDKYPPKYVAVYSKRVSCANNGDFSKQQSSAIAYAWYIWEKGYTGNSILKWI